MRWALVRRWAVNRINTVPVTINNDNNNNDDIDDNDNDSERSSHIASLSFFSFFFPNTADLSNLFIPDQVFFRLFFLKVIFIIFYN